MRATVAVVDSDSLSDGIELIGGIDDLNRNDMRLVVKVGIYNSNTGICTTPKTLKAIIDSFNLSPEILIAESDSGAGLGLDRLKIWDECYNERVIPYNLSNDELTREVEIAGEQVPFSHVVLDPNTFVSTHVPRRYEGAGLEDLMNLGFNIKNLLGLILDKKKNRFHKQLPNALVDMFVTVGGIDLAVLDATTTFLGYKKKRTSVPTNVLIIGRDAFAVEAVGMHLVGFDPLENPVLKEGMNRNLGEINLANIEILGDIESPRNRILDSFNKLRE